MSSSQATSPEATASCQKQSTSPLDLSHQRFHSNTAREDETSTITIKTEMSSTSPLPLLSTGPPLMEDIKPDTVSLYESLLQSYVTELMRLRMQSEIQSTTDTLISHHCPTTTQDVNNSIFGTSSFIPPTPPSQLSATYWNNLCTILSSQAPQTTTASSLSNLNYPIATSPMSNILENDNNSFSKPIVSDMESRMKKYLDVPNSSSESFKTTKMCTASPDLCNGQLTSTSSSLRPLAFSSTSKTLSLPTDCLAAALKPQSPSPTAVTSTSSTSSCSRKAGGSAPGSVPGSGSGSGHLRETAFVCSCGAEFDSLYVFTLHMKQHDHGPRPEQRERDLPKLVRGQDMWINSESEQTREILRCMRCKQSFSSLAELTMHMIKTGHYSDIVYSDSGRCVFIQPTEGSSSSQTTNCTGQQNVTSQPSTFSSTRKRLAGDGNAIGSTGARKSSQKRLCASSSDTSFDTLDSNNQDYKNLKKVVHQANGSDSQLASTTIFQTEINEADSATVVDTKMDEDVVDEHHSPVIRRIENLLEKSLPSERRIGSGVGNISVHNVTPVAFKSRDQNSNCQEAYVAPDIGSPMSSNPLSSLQKFVETSSKISNSPPPNLSLASESRHPISPTLHHKHSSMSPAMPSATDILMNVTTESDTSVTSSSQSLGSIGLLNPQISPSVNTPIVSTYSWLKGLTSLLPSVSTVQLPPRSSPNLSSGAWSTLKSNCGDMNSSVSVASTSSTTLYPMATSVSTSSAVLSKKAKCHHCGKPFANKGQVRLHISKGKCPTLLQSCHAVLGPPPPPPSRVNASSLHRMSSATSSSSSGLLGNSSTISGGLFPLTVTSSANGPPPLSAFLPPSYLFPNMASDPLFTLAGLPLLSSLPSSLFSCHPLANFMPPPPPPPTNPPTSCDTNVQLDLLKSLYLSIMSATKQEDAKKLSSVLAASNTAGL